MSPKAFFALLIILGTISLTLTHKTEFQKYKSKFSKRYENAAIQSYRQAIFTENSDKINKHNNDPSRTYDQGQNQFTDITQQEFIQNYLGLELPNDIDIKNNADQQNGDAGNNSENHGNSRNLQTTIDWRGKAVTPVKNQGACGSCWAFSANGALESLSIIGYGLTKIFSQQQLVDCSGSYGNAGCNGGWMNYAFNYVKAVGIELSSNYPYVGYKQTCKKNGGAFKISGYVAVTAYSTPALVTALAKEPVSVAVDATNWGPYKTGVFSNCGTSLNHGVLLVATISNNWIIKNSWGTTWGSSGYMTLAPGNTCGILMAPSYPLK